MKSFIAVLAVVFVSAEAGLVGYAGYPGYPGYGLGYAGLGYAGLGHVAYSAPVSTQYHAQDELGQYSYGYSGGPSAKTETRTLDGITRGAYSYVDAHGLLQNVQYVSDPVNGFRQVGPSLTAVQDAPDVALAKAEHFAAHAQARAALAAAA